MPNPPPTFTGRRAEIALAAEVLRRGPLAVLHGAEGAGKTALALQLLKRRFAKRLVASVRIAELGDDPAVACVRALAAAEGVSAVDWPALLAEPDALVATAIDLAERRPRVVLLEDVDRVDAGRARALLSAVARFARRSLWVVTARAPLGFPDLAGVEIPVPPLAVTELEVLARRLTRAASASMVRNAARLSSGSPARLREAMLGPDPSAVRLPDTGPDRLLLGSLALVQRSLAETTLGLLAPGAGVSRLESSGWLERTPAGVSVAAPVRGTRRFPPGPAPQELARRLLTCEDDPAAVLEGLRLSLEAGEIEEARVALDRSGASLALSGFAPEMAELLRASADPRLEVHRLRVALELGDAAALASLREPEDPSAQDRILWARALLARGKPVDAAAAARTAAEAAAPGEIRFEAALVEARALANLGRPAEVRDRLQREEPAAPSDRARRDVRLAQSLLELGDNAAAARAARDLASRAGRLPEAAAREVRYGAARIFFFLGELDAAARLIAAIAPGEARASLYNERQLLSFRAALALDAGHLEECGSLLRTLERWVGRYSLQHPFLAHMEIQRRMAAGELEGLASLLEERIAEAAAASNAHHYYPAIAFRIRLGTLLGERAPHREPPIGLPAPLAPFDGLLALYGLEHRARLGESVDAPDPSRFADVPELEILAHTVRAAVLLSAGESAEAAAAAANGAALAHERGYGLRRADALLLQAESLLVAGREAEVRRVAGALDGLARVLASRRFAGEAAFLRVTSQERPDAAGLLGLLDETNGAAAARRAAAVLDGEEGVTLDAIDRRLVGVVRARGVRTRRIAGGTGIGWGVDLAAKEVWLGDGRRIALRSRAQLWKLLLSLVEAGGSAGKEALVQAVWEESEYHPLRHDNRLQAAVRQLRRLVEDDPEHPARLVTSPEGYALAAGPVRVSGES